MKKLMMLFTFFLMGIGMVTAQTSKVTGIVTSASDGEPVVGATIAVKEVPTLGVATGLDGRFTLSNLPAAAKTLVVSYIGMNTQEVRITPNMKIVLEEDSEVLDEVVISIAYGAAKKSSLTGAIANVGADKIEARPTSSVVAALEGSVSGIQMNSTYGAPGTDPDIRIRGVGTINGSSSPLYVIDGVPFGGNISDLNPADIESMSVLKDAASASLYGNRASNGVILITTKQGKTGKMQVSVDVKQGTYSRGIKEYELCNPYEFMEATWMNMKNQRLSAGDDAAAAAAYASQNLVSDYLYLNIFNKADNQLFDANGKMVSDATILPGYTNDLDWYKDAIRNGYRQEYVLSASGANDKADYYFSTSYLDENGYLKDSGFERFTARTAINVQPVTWFKTGVNLSGSYQKYNNTNGNSDASYTNAFMYCRNIAPIYPVHLHNPANGEYVLDANGEYQYDSGYFTDADNVTYSTRNQYADRHVIWENELNWDRTTRTTLEGTVFADFYFLKDFVFTVRGNLNVRNSKNGTYNSGVIGDGKGNNGRAKSVSYLYKNYTFQQQLRWSHSFGDHSLNVLLGHENYSYNYDYQYGYKTNQVFPNNGALQNFTSITDLYGWENNYRTESYLGRIRYNYADKYNVEASFRRDGSSRFYKDNRWGNFFSVGANWMISNEDFMKDVKWVNSLKLRADWGQVGNDAGAGYYGYMALYTSDQNANKGAYYLAQNANNDLKWETGESWGVGIDARLFNRLNLTLDYFDKRNKDLLFDVYLPLSAGATSSSSAEAVVTKNLGVISNRGFEIEADVDVVRTRNWRVNIGANATILKNKVVTLPDQNKDGIIDGTKKIMEGMDRYAFYMYTFEGVDQMTGQSVYKFNDENYYITSDNTADGEVLFGSLTREVTDSEGNVTTVDNTLMAAADYTMINGIPYVNNTTYAKREFHGSALPDVYGSFSLGVSYKSLSLNALFTYSLGGYTYDGVYAGLLYTVSSPNSLHKDVLKSWNGVPEGMTEDSPNRIDPNGLPELNSTTYNLNNATSSRFLTSANYLVLKNISLSYQLPKAWVTPLKLSSVTLSATCENLFTLTARQGMNPQQTFSGTQSNYLVTPRVFSAALNIKF